MPATLNLYLIRHGQTEYNAAGIVQGWCDSPLTAEGKAGAAQTGNAIAQAQIPIAAAYCSTSPRTAATAQIILQHARQPHITPVALDDLREYHFGSFERQPSRLADTNQGSLKTSNARFCEATTESSAQNVLIVSHGMAITALLRSINPQAIAYRSVPNASATLLRYNLTGGLQIISEAGKAL